MKYCNIVFVHDYEDSTVNRLLHEFNSIEHDDPIKESVDYLSQWDYGKESEYDLVDDPPYGTSDYTEQIEEYVLSYNLRLGYMALCRIVYSEEEERLINSLCDDIAMLYNGKPNTDDIQYTIADYESLYDTLVSSAIIAEIYRLFDVK